MPSTDVFISNPEHCIIHPCGWVDLPSGPQITRMPLWDENAHLFARLGHGPAADHLKAQGLRLPVAAEYEQLHELALHIDPYPMPTIPMIRDAGVPLGSQAAINAFRSSHMQSRRWCELHDAEVFRRLLEADWDGEPVANAGKHWVKGGLILGWWKRDGGRIQNLSRAHVSHGGHTDYATTVHAVDDRRDIASIEETPLTPPDELDPDVSHGQRAVEWSLRHVGVSEHPPGSNKGPEVSRWLRPCQRESYGPELGAWLAGSGANWCAAFACAADAATRLDSDPPRVHAYRASGIEMENDAKAAGVWRDVALLRAGTWEPAAGDVVIWQSGDGSPGQRWRRHVARFVEREGSDTFVAVGGNEDNQVRVSGGRRFDEEALLGFIELPRVEDPGWDPAPIRRAVELERKLWAGVVGMDAFDELVAELEATDPRDW